MIFLRQFSDFNRQERANPQIHLRPVRLLLICIICALPIVIGRPGTCQAYLSQTGQPTFSVTEPVQSGFVNVANGNLHLEIPLASFPQRGSRNLSFSLQYDSRIWAYDSAMVWEANQNPILANWGGWRLVSSADPGNLTFSTASIYCGNNNYGNLYYNYLFYSSDGTPHLFPTEASSCGGNPTNSSTYDSDASGYMLVIANSAISQLIAPGGTEVYTPTSSRFSEDTNGNYYSYDASYNVIDTLGRVPLKTTTNCGGSNKTCYDVLNSQGGTMRFIVTTESIPVHTAFSQQYVTEHSGNITVIQSIELPDGNSYAFSYDSGTAAGHYGEVTSMTLPTQATVDFGYSVFQDALGNKNHWITSYLAAGGSWSYTPNGVNTSQKTQNVLVEEPSGNYKTYSFSLNNGAWKNQVVYTSGLTIADSWTSSSCVTPPGAPACSGNTNFQMQSETVSVPSSSGNINRTTQWSYPSNTGSFQSTTSEWNYYTGSLPAQPSRITNYYYLGGSQYSNANINNRVAKIVVTDGSGSTKLSETDYGYDEAGGLSSAPTGIIHHDDSDFGSSNTIRGNRTSIKQWVSGSSYITTSTQEYDITGQLVQLKDANSNQTSYSYADCFYNDNGSNPGASYTPSSPTNSYLTATTLPASGVVTACYYFGSGKPAIAKDQNNVASYFHFMDVDDRATTSYTPIHGWTLNSYTSPTQLDTYRGIQDTTASTSCSSCRHDQAIADTLGRITEQILVSDPDGQTISMKTDYDTDGRALDTYHPYRSATDPTYGKETYTYDLLDRPIETAHADGTAIRTYYGSAVVGAGGITNQLCSANCNLGYPVLTADEAGKMRQVWNDAFGNVVEVDEAAAATQEGTATGSVAFSGTEQQTTFNPCPPPNSCWQTVYDAGNFSIAVGILSKTISYGQGSTPYTIASAVASAFNSDPNSPATATANANGTVNFTSVYNYPLSSAIENWNQSFFAHPSFTGTPSSFTGSPLPLATPTVTYYQYDPLGRLTNVAVMNQSVCNRTYIYDSLSRMISATEPETGDTGNGTCPLDSTHITAFTYSNPGSLCSGDITQICTRTDGRNITTTYHYSDPLNRITGIAYSDTTPPVSYFYDQSSYNGLTITNGAGRRTGMSDGSGKTAWSFDGNGNVLSEERTIGSVTKTIGYTYNGDGSLKQLTYPSGRIVKFTVGNAERNTTVIDNDGTQYVLAPPSGAMYAPTGAFASALYGKGSVFGGLTEARTYNNRLQLTGITGSSSAGSVLNLGFMFTGTNHPNNNEILIASNNIDTGRTQNSAFDAVGRIKSAASQANSGADCWGQNFTIDPVGNLTDIAVAKCSSTSFSSAVNGNNQLSSGYTYDHSGSISNDGFYSFTYNGEGQIASAGTVNYTYDGNRTRVEKSSGTLYWRDAGGSTIAETNLSGTTTNEYVFFGGRRVVQRDPSGNLYLYLADQIGSTRSITKVATSGSASICYDADFAPYGSEIAHTNSCSPNYKFTGYERDTETGLDYALNRYYNPRIGRFMSTDPLGTASVNQTNPQSSNRYTYVANNPSIFVDSTGTDIDLCSFSGIQPDPTQPSFCIYSQGGVVTMGGVPDYFSAAYGGPPPTLTMGCISSFGDQQGGGGCPKGASNQLDKVGYQGGDATTIPQSYFDMVYNQWGVDESKFLLNLGYWKQGVMKNGDLNDYTSWTDFFKDMGFDYKGLGFQTPTPMAIPPHPSGCSLLTGSLIEDIIAKDPIPPNLNMAIRLVCHNH